MEIKELEGVNEAIITTITGKKLASDVYILHFYLRMGHNFPPLHIITQTLSSVSYILCVGVCKIIKKTERVFS